MSSGVRDRPRSFIVSKIGEVSSSVVAVISTKWALTVEEYARSKLAEVLGVVDMNEVRAKGETLANFQPIGMELINKSWTAVVYMRAGEGLMSSAFSINPSLFDRQGTRSGSPGQ